MSSVFKTVFAAVSLVAGVASLSAASHAGQTATHPVSIVELFTSQGCSSCPPADHLLGELAASKDIIALTYNVDYWDYLGWKDTLASPRNSERQRAYARTRGDGEVYTPQAVVNGVAHTVGSRRARVEAAITESAQRLSGRRPPVTALRQDHMIMIHVGDAATQPSRPATVWLAVVRPSVTIPIQRGENRGATITYTNVVRSISPVGTWSGQPTTLKLQESSVLSNGSDRCVILVQDGMTGPLLAAAWVSMN